MAAVQFAGHLLASLGERLEKECASIVRKSVYRLGIVKRRALLQSGFLCCGASATI